MASSSSKSSLYLETEVHVFQHGTNPHNPGVSKILNTTEIILFIIQILFVRTVILIDKVTICKKKFHYYLLVRHCIEQYFYKYVKNNVHCTEIISINTAVGV